MVVYNTCTRSLLMRASLRNMYRCPGITGWSIIIALLRCVIYVYNVREPISDYAV